ncbi:MAG: DUF4118 domain-containing protein, partial [Chloroflexi bacterium]|nr:DUF4118 domain-containing protein [Chloroflexota bacterium]
MRSLHHALRNALIALTATLLTSAALALLWPLLEPSLILLFAAVVVSAWYGGWGAAAPALMLTSAAAWLFLQPPGQVPNESGLNVLAHWLLYGGAAAFLAWLTLRLRGALDRAQTLQREADQWAHTLRTMLDTLPAGVIMAEAGSGFDSLDRIGVTVG